MKTFIEVSARHIHLTEEHYKKIFQKDEISVRNYLNGDKETYASPDTVEIVGPGGSIHNVRVLGPFRDNSQVEISKTDAFSLDIDAPLELSETGAGAEIRVIGPAGEFTGSIAIIAKRHLHASPEIASAYHLKQEQIIKVKVSGERGLIFDNVIVRISPEFVNHVHVDTDEGNAAGINKIVKAEIIVS